MTSRFCVDWSNFPFSNVEMEDDVTDEIMDDVIDEFEVDEIKIEEEELHLRLKVPDKDIGDENEDQSQSLESGLKIE